MHLFYLILRIRSEIVRIRSDPPEKSQRLKLLKISMADNVIEMLFLDLNIQIESGFATLLDVDSDPDRATLQAKTKKTRQILTTMQR